MKFKAWSYKWFSNKFSKHVYDFVPTRFIPIVHKYLVPIKGTILDAGCGSGNIFLNTEELNCSELVGLDINERARKNNPYINSFIRMDLHDLHIKNKFEGIISVHTWEHLENPVKVLRNFYHALLPGGILIIIAPSQWNVVSIIARTLSPRVLEILYGDFLEVTLVCLIHYITVYVRNNLL